jgi:cytochrome c5
MAAALLGACGGERDDEPAAAEPLVEDPQHPPGVPPAPNPPAGDVVGPSGITKPMLALGDSVFHGRVGGAACTTCHGADAKGTSLGPDLTDRTWLHTDGTYQSIVNVVTLGVEQPKRYPAAMPPMGGATLTPDQVKAVAAYVYSLNAPP